MAKDFNDEIESDPADDEIESDPAIAWLKAQLKLTSARQLGLKYEIDRTVITRNMNDYRDGKGLAGPFRKRIEAIIEQERLEEMHRQHLAEQAAAAELERQEELAREAEAKERAEREAAGAKARKKAERDARAAAAKAKADQDRRQQEQDAVVYRAIKGWADLFREAGYLPAREMVEGDAEELFLAGVSKLSYVDIGVAAVALLPDHIVVWRDKTAKFFREGVPYTQRLQPTAVRKGQPRPEMIGNLPASVVYYDPLPDQLWRYGKEGVEIITEWGRLTDTYGHMATGELPRVVHPETVAAFERLIDIEEHSGYVFEDSCLGPDARDRLKALQHRAVLPVIGLATTGITWAVTKFATKILWAVTKFTTKVAWAATKLSAHWFCSEGWKWLAFIVIALLSIVVVYFVAIGVWEVLKWVEAWIKANQGVSILGGAIFLGVGAVVWWIWPKRGDVALDVVRRVGAVMLVAVALGIFITGAVITVSAVIEMAALSEAFAPYWQNIYIP